MYTGLSDSKTQRTNLPSSGSDIEIEKPLAPARPNGKQGPVTELPDENRGSLALQEKYSLTRATELAREIRLKQLQKQHQIDQKYQSIDSMDRHEKIETLSHPDINPFLLKDPYDSLSVAFNRWKYVADNAMLNHMSDKDRETIAGKYYDAVIAPQYQRLQKPAMDRNLWLAQAYKEATQYNLANAYDNTVWHDMKHGWNEGVPALARMGETIYNVFTNFFSKPQEYTDEEYSRWYTRSANAISPPRSFTDARNPSSLVNVGSRRQQENHQFWADALPTTGGWAAKSTSFIAEQATELPIYATLAAVPSVGAENLTARLALSPMGKKVTQYLMTGAEGTAYGVLTRPKDKIDSWKDGLAWSVFHMGFDVLGAGGSKVLDALGRKTKITDLVAETKGIGSKEFEALKKRQDELELSLQGKRSANPEELYAQRKKEAATNIAMVGIEGQRQIYADALRHVENMESVEKGQWSREQIKEYEKGLLKDDPARWSPVLAAANYVRSLLGDKKLLSIEKDQEATKFLTGRIAKLITDSAAEIPQHVPELAAQGAAEAVEKDAKNAGVKTLEYFKAQVQAEAEKTGAAEMLSKEQLDKLAQKQWADAVTKARQKAAQKLTETPVKDAVKAAKALVAPEKPTQKALPAPKTEIRTARTENNPGDIYVRYQLNPSYKVYLQKMSKGLGMNMNSKAFSDYLSNFYDALEDKDFAQDMQEHFYPKELQKAGVWFEHQWKAPIGPEYPNFLAFMYNYKDQMPLEMAKELEERLVGTDKFQQAFKGGAKTQPLLDYYSQAMYNHVDDFLSSGRWPQESNLFRSSNSDIRNTTKWQKELLLERNSQELENVRDAFSKHPEVAKAVVTQLKKLQQTRMSMFLRSYEEDPNSRKTVAALSDLISRRITESGKYERWNF